MVVFLTSSFVEYQPKEGYVPKPLDESNHFGDNLRKYWKENSNFLVFTSDPLDTKMTDHVVEEMYDAFTLAGFSLGEIRSFDYRSIGAEETAKEALKKAMQWADVFFLAGGHCPTENAFMKECDLKSLIHNPDVFDGIFIGLSAGSVNAAEDVYLIPELKGESIDPEFVRFTDGLGLTDINMLPHSQHMETVMLDGKHMIDDIVSGDSSGREIYVIPDGTYFMIRNGMTEFFGTGKIMENSVTRPLKSGMIHSDKMLRAMATDYYEWILELNPQSGKIKCYYISPFLLSKGIFPVNIDTYEELCRIYTDLLVVKDEKTAAFEQLAISIVLDEITEKESYVRTIHIDTEDGVRAESIRIKRIAEDDHRLLVCLTDISMILDRDWMTDQYSRSGFLSKAEKWLKEQDAPEAYSVVYTNIQGFKAVNDLLGTFCGDMVIFQVRDALIQELKPVMIARLESDHFALITKNEYLTEETMEKLCYQFYEEDSKRMPIVIQCGIYHMEGNRRNILYMLDRAKLAEHSISSDHGMAYAVCDQKMSDDYVNQRVLVSEIDGALERGEFQTYYQPVVDTMTGEIVSAEALIRWKHAEWGMISPGQFIPIFEKEGLITKIDSFMVKRALEFNIERLRQGKKVVPFAINLSRVDFYDTKLMDTIKDMLKKQENVRDLLKLEVTESAYAVLENDAIAFLEDMKKLEISLLLDDFGSGMSSLSTLESFEFDVIKLDMGFINKIGKSIKAEGIIKHTIGLSHDIGAKVVAEGVETEEQLTFLQKAGCDMIQGYYFYRPMSEEEFSKLL